MARCCRVVGGDGITAAPGMKQVSSVACLMYGTWDRAGFEQVPHPKKEIVHSVQVPPAWPTFT